MNGLNTHKALVIVISELVATIVPNNEKKLA